MQFIIDLIATKFHLLHNAGVFQYQKGPMLFFAMKLLFFPATLVMVLFFIFLIILKRPRLKKPLLCAILIVILFSLGTSVIIYPSTISKLYFAKGYHHYLNNRDNKACDYYFKAISMDSFFTKPLEELFTIFKENPTNEILLMQISQIVDMINEPAWCELLGRLYEEKKQYIDALKYYKKAQKKNQSIKSTVNIARTLIALMRYQEAESELDIIMQHALKRELSEDILFLRSLIEYKKGAYEKADANIDTLIQLDGVNPIYYIHKARLLSRLGNEADALRLLSHALSLKKELPVAYFEMAKIYYMRQDHENAKTALHKTLYYDNQNSLAYVMLQMLIRERWLPLSSLIYDENMQPSLDRGKNELKLTKGDSVNLRILFKNITLSNQFIIGILEPFGFGIQGDLVRENEISDADGNREIEAVFNIKANRASKVNLNQPWVINIVFADLNTGKFVNQKVFVNVNDRKDEEGRILLVITEDHEQTSDFPHSDNTPGIQDIDPYEINVDLVKKGMIADDIANKYGVKWSHIIDIGSSLLRLKWIQNGRHGHQWDTVWDEMASYLKRTVKSGHDVQLHIHAYSIPDNKLFRQYFDAKADRILFRDNIVRIQNDRGTHGAWADNFKDLGYFNEPNSRIGSIFRGIRLLEKELHTVDPNYRTVFFRAGEYEFGSDDRSVIKSILALNKNKILTGSDAYDGNRLIRGFKFFKPVGKNVYFSKSDNIRERTNSLLDIGLLEIVPVPRMNGHDYVRPIDEWKHIKYNYDLCLSDGKIKNDVFILMEMYHLNNVNARYGWDETSKDYEDWARMDDHFRGIRLKCPKMEFVTISEAIKIYLDHYSPDIVTLRTNEIKLTDKLYSYDIEFYGQQIEVSGKRPHFVSIKPPSYFLGRIDQINLIHRGTVVKNWTDIKDYADLEFQIIEKAGYKCNVYLK